MRTSRGVQELADGVSSYEQLRSAGEEKFTSVSLLVVTSAGVLITVNCVET